VNLLFGYSGSNLDTQFGSFDEKVSLTFQEETISLIAESGLVRIGSIDDKGKVLGSHKKGRVSLCFLGAICQPLVGWKNGSPLDDPNATAEHLLGLYQSKGVAFLDEIAGQYAIIIIDEEEDAVILATDPSCMRNLYYLESNGEIIFSTSIYALAQAFNRELKINRDYEDFLLSYGFVPFGKTFYQDVIDLTGDKYLVWRKGEGTLYKRHNKNPWKDQYHIEEIVNAPEDKAIQLMYDAFMTAVEEVSSSSADAAVLLGGVDSALIAAALSRLGKRVETFSFQYHHEEMNQTHTDTLAEYLGIKHNWYRITPEIISNGLDKYNLYYNRPTNWSNYVIQTSSLSRHIREKGFATIYTGDGCDGVFLGYPRTHSTAKFFESSFRIPGVVISILEKLLCMARIEYVLGRPFRVGMNILRNLARRPPARGYIPFRIMDDISLKHLRAGPPPKQEHGIEEVLRLLTSGLEHLSAARRAYMGKGGVGLNKLKMSSAGDFSGLPLVSPYLHPGLAEFARTLPGHMLRPPDQPKYSVLGKYILLRMAEEKQLLPPSVIFQKKISAVEGPIDSWFFGQLKEKLRAKIQDLPFEVNMKYVDNLLKQKAAERLYVKHVSSDHLTTHELSMLATYASYAEICEGDT
jgi:hypothetical protein